MKIIAFTGPGGAGKNTAAEALGTEWHTNEVAFTAPLYDMAAAALGHTPEQINQLKQQGDKAIRAMLEQLGDVVRNTIRPDYLIVRLVDTLRELEDSQDTPGS
jgi:anion-transporting  ArsA/GET3 family ATPase